MSLESVTSSFQGAYFWFDSYGVNCVPFNCRISAVVREFEDTMEKMILNFTAYKKFERVSTCAPLYEFVV